MYYSILPIDENISYDIEYKEITYKGQKILIKRVGGVQIVERLFSTNPQDYMSPEFQPGTILENPLIKG